MAYDLEEQEQLAAVKAWWKDYGGMVTLVVVAAALTIAGWRGWQWYQNSQTMQAGTLYEQLTSAVQANDAKAVRDASGALIENHPRTLYASMAALVAARFLFEQGDLRNVKAQLEWVVANSKSPEFRDTARLRLAGVLLDGKAHDAALKAIEGTPSPGFESQYSALRGDILYASGKRPEARSAYQAALDRAKKHNPGSTAFQESVRMRLEAIGG
jgi:predicted negative regulator of RcsB-dependent stress response